jgi:hypothetical protein
MPGPERSHRSTAKKWVKERLAKSLEGPLDVCAAFGVELSGVQGLQGQGSRSHLLDVWLQRAVEGP